MAEIKISDLTAKGANLDTTDLLIISEDDGAGGYVSKYITGAELASGSSATTLYSGDSTIGSTRVATLTDLFLLTKKSFRRQGHNYLTILLNRMSIAWGIVNCPVISIIIFNGYLPSRASNREMLRMIIAFQRFYQRRNLAIPTE